MGEVSVGPVVGMVMSECMQAGLLILSKVAMSDGMSEFVFIFYSNALATLILFPSSYLFQRSDRERPEFTFSILAWFLLLGLLAWVRIFSWSSKKQDVIAQSTAEAEYVAANATVNQAIWIRKILADLHMKQAKPTEIYVDNQAAIAISNHPIFHGRTKHFKIKLYNLREEQKAGEIKLVYCKTENQIADMFTKALPEARFEVLRNKLSLCSY